MRFASRSNKTLLIKTAGEILLDELNNGGMDAHSPPAAEEAVKQRVYRPTLLNGDPVEVATVVDVNIMLAREN